jgi:hypothetical protein
MSIVIEKNIPFHSTDKESIYPFKKMEIGDSFSLPINETTNVRSAIQFFKKRGGTQKFATRTFGDVVRIWRIK